MTMDDIVFVQVFCPDVSLYGRFNDVYKTYFGARAFVGSGPLLRGAISRSTASLSNDEEIAAVRS
jgi:2-iminobutanoate/2-iminopropanoate deaminase